MPRRWQSTGSPTATLAEEKFGSLRVHCKRVPAGRTTSRALAPTLRRDTRKPSAITARVANANLDFIPHLGRTPRIDLALNCRTHAKSPRGFANLITTLFRGQLAEFGHPW